jgi:hypothetical protein
LAATAFNLTAAAPKDNPEIFNPIQVAIPILSVSPDARASGMGDMGVATLPDANSQHWNPAKYPFVNSTIGGSVSHIPWLRSLVNDVSITYLTVYYQFSKDQSISTSLRYFSLGEMTIIDQDRHELDKVSPYEMAWDVSYSRKFGDNFSIGLTLRYMHSNLTGGFEYSNESFGSMEPANVFGADLGFFYRNAQSRTSEYSAGLCLSNLGTKVSYTDYTDKYFLPMTLKFGGTYTYHIDEDNSIMGGLEISKLLIPTPPVVSGDTLIKGYDDNVGVIQGAFQSFYDAPFGWKEELSEYMLGVGGEYAYRSQFFGRAGFYYDSKRKGNRRYLTFGAGLRYSFLGIDLAYYFPFTNNDPMANTIKISVLFNFGELGDR